MPCSRRIILVLLFISLTPACSFQESRPLAPIQSGALVTPSAVSPSPDTSPLVIVTPRSPSTPGSEASSVTPSLTLTDSIASLEWTTYHDPKGVIIEYPVGYEVRSFPWDYVRFDAPNVDAELPTIRETFALEVSLRSLADREIANPYSWQDASVKVHWGTSIAVEGAKGWLFVWGEENFDGRFPDPGLWQRSAELMAIYYNEQNQVDVRITTSFDDESTLLAQQIGLVETVRQRYPVFEHVMNSVRFVEPVIPPDEAIAQMIAASPAPPETFITPSGVTVEYPGDWKIETAPSQQPIDWFKFVSPDVEGQTAEIGTEIVLEVKSLPLAERETIDPHSWVPNEGGYEAHWLTPLQVEGAEGWLFVWGVSHFEHQDPNAGLWQQTPSLMAIYYSQQHELEVRVTTTFDDESTSWAQDLGLAETVAIRYPFFDHMMRSVRFVEPTQP
jgi:hypothetical protein